MSVEVEASVDVQEEVDSDDDIDVEQLILLVQERELLWDKSLEDYKNRNKNREAWREICQTLLIPGFEEKSAAEMKQLGDRLIKKWRNIRDRWMKHIRKDKDSKKSGAGAKKVKKYVYHDQLQFLKKIAHQNDTEDSINEPEGGNDASQTEEKDDPGTPIIAKPNKPKAPKKRKRNEDEFELKMMKILEKPDDEDETFFGFFRSMVPTLKTLTNDQFVEFQIGVLGVLKNVKAQGKDQGTSHVPPTQYHHQVNYPYSGSQPPNMYYPHQQPQFPPQFSEQAFANSYVYPNPPKASTSSEQCHRRNQKASQEASNQQTTPLSSTPTSSILSLDFDQESNDWNV